MPTERDKDQELEQYLAGRDGLMQVYRSTAGEEPPAHLDGAILAASRKALGAKPGRIYTRWHVPVSLAAVVVLSVLVVFNLPDERTLTYTPASAGNAAEEFAQGKMEMERDAAAGEAEGPAAAAVPTQEPLRRPAAPAPAQSREEAGFSGPAAGSTAERRVLRFEVETPAMIKSLPAEDRADAAAPPREQLEAESLRLRQALDPRPPEETNNQVTAQSGGRQADTDGGAATTACTMPRPEACTMEYRPVCAVKETAASGTETSGYSNACHACNDPAVTGYTLGACSAEPQ